MNAYVLVSGLVLTSLLAVRVATQPRWWIIDPVTTSAAMLCLIYVAGPAYRWIAGVEIDYGLPSLDSFADADRSGAVASLAFAVGAMTIPTRRRRPSAGFTPRRLTSQAGRTTLVCATLVGTVLFGLFATSVGWQTLLAGRTRELATMGRSEYLSAAPVVIPAAVCAIVGWDGGWLTRYRRHAFMVATAIAISVCLLLLLGNRRFAIPAVLLPSIVYFISANRLPKRRVLAAAAIVLLFVSSFVSIARSAGAREQAGGVDAIAVRLLREPIETVDRVLAGPDANMRDFLQYHIEAVDDELGYDGARGLVRDLLWEPVPAFLVNGKPPSVKEETLFYYYGEGCVASGGRCPDYGLVGSLYRVGGDPMVVGGMYVAGVLLSVVWTRAARRSTGPHLYLLSAMATVFAPIVVRKGLLSPAIHPLYFVIPAFVLLAAFARADLRLGELGGGPSGRRRRSGALGHQSVRGPHVSL